MVGLAAVYCIVGGISGLQDPSSLVIAERSRRYAPLEQVTLASWLTGTIKVADGAGHVYFEKPFEKTASFLAAGALGRHQVVLLDKDGKEAARATFEVGAKTGISDPSGDWDELLDYAAQAIATSKRPVRQGDRVFQAFGTSLRAQIQAGRGARYYEEQWKDFLDAMSASQREDGHVSPLGSTRKDDDARVEADYAWGSALALSSEDDKARRTRLLATGVKAVDAAVKAAGTGAVMVEGSVPLGANLQLAQAATALSEAAKMDGNAAESERLSKLAEAHLAKIRGTMEVQGRFADRLAPGEAQAASASRISGDHALALRLGLTPDEEGAIIDFYRSLETLKPPGGVGEWFTMYPPRPEAGSEWDGMNGGVSGEVAGDLALASLRTGREAYGVDVLKRLSALAKKDGRLPWGWRGSPFVSIGRQLTPVNIGTAVNHPLQSVEGLDLTGLPSGTVQLAGIPWDVVKPTAPDAKSVLVVSRRENFDREAGVLLNLPAASVYVLFAPVNLKGQKDLGAAILRYDDGSEYAQVLRDGEDIASGSAWKDGTLRWAAIDNPNPSKAIRSVSFAAPYNGASLVILGVTISDRPHPGPSSLASSAGEASASGGVVAEAILRGLAGIELSANETNLVPRWAATPSEDVVATARLAGQSQYASYRFRHDPAARKITLSIAASSPSYSLRTLLPRGASRLTGVKVNGQAIKDESVTVGTSLYASVPIKDAAGVTTVELGYAKS